MASEQDIRDAAEDYAAYRIRRKAEIAKSWSDALTPAPKKAKKESASANA